MTGHAQRPRPRLPGVAFSALALALVVLIAVLTLTVSQPPPPTIAEFAPQAVENITESPEDQSSTSGKGAGVGAGDGGVSLLATPEPTAAINVPRVRRCVGDPPRQIEDPQSPPCVPYWTGDNGGATSKGVTRDEVRVVIPQFDDTVHPFLEGFFNQRFEFYGRQVRFLALPGGAGAGDPAGQRAAAIRADEEVVSFASSAYTNGLGFDYYDELARRGIVSAAGAYSPLTEPAMAAHAPYFWQYPMGADSMLANLGEWACARVARQPARHAGDPTYTERTRTLGVITETWTNTAVSSRPLLERLASCDASPKVVFDVPGTTDSAEFTNRILRLRNEGVTTVICNCHSVNAGVMAKTATTQAYFPEWITSTYIEGDDNYSVIPFWNAEQLSHTFGLTFRPRQQKPSSEPSRWAVKEANPAAGAGGDDTSYLRWSEKLEYQPILLLMSGIQLAGPRLTPMTFEAGLHKATFPNPAHPIMAGAVGFRNGDHSMTDNAAEMWWSPSSRSPYTDQSGTACYVNGGARQRLGAWTKADIDPFFQGACDSGA